MGVWWILFAFIRHFKQKLLSISTKIHQNEKMHKTKLYDKILCKKHQQNNTLPTNASTQKCHHSKTVPQLEYINYMRLRAIRTKRAPRTLKSFFIFSCGFHSKNGLHDDVYDGQVTAGTSGPWWGPTVGCFLIKKRELA